MRFFNQNRTEIIGQSLVFSIYGLLGLAQSYAEKGAWEIEGVLIVTAVECLLVNLNANWLMVICPVQKQPLRYSLGLIGLWVGYILIRYLTAFPDFIDMLNTYNGEGSPPSVPFFFFIQTINFIASIIVSIGIRLYKDGLRAERRAHMLENEINEARLAALKYQVNPHFLYNTLSYMYAQARPVSDNLARSILILSDMMRYSLSKTDENGSTSIEKEISYIQNFIGIYRLRFEGNCYVNFDIEGIVNGRQIVPLLLITFVENAFKHGTITDPQRPVSIRLRIARKQLTFTVHNYKQPGIKDATSGIGLDNTRKRLQLAYPQQHELTIVDQPDEFNVLLIINFS